MGYQYRSFVDGVRGDSYFSFRLRRDGSGKEKEEGKIIIAPLGDIGGKHSHQCWEAYIL
jgi:hypothetical protein